MFDFRPRTNSDSPDHGTTEPEPVAAKIVHAIPGRIRVKLPALKGDAKRQEMIERRLRAIPHVEAVEPNRRCASFVVRFAAQRQDDVVRQLAEVLPDLTDERPAAHSAHSEAQRAAPFQAADIAKSFERLNREVEQATGGMDLGLLLPAGLFVLGVLGVLLGLFKARRLSSPDWYDYWWFAFNTFVILNVTLSQSRFGEARNDAPPATAAQEPR